MLRRDPDELFVDNEFNSCLVLEARDGFSIFNTPVLLLFCLAICLLLRSELVVGIRHFLSPVVLTM